MADITQKSKDLIYHFFSKNDKDIAMVILSNECGNNLPCCENYSLEELDRIRFAAIKLSDGNIEQLQSAVTLAKTDWRDLLMYADFASNLNAYKIWADTILA